MNYQIKARCHDGQPEIHFMDASSGRVLFHWKQDKSSPDMMSDTYKLKELIKGLMLLSSVNEVSM